MTLARGSRVGVYEVTAPIGAGGMGEVYRARDLRLEREVAIKVLPRALAADPDRLTRFEREARVLAALNHRNIATIYGIEQAGDSPAIVMELVEGITLADKVAAGPIDVREALAIARELSEALDAAHERGVVHRDLKPANIKLTSAGEVKVLDFGLAKIVRRSDEAPETETRAALDRTSVGVVMGTAAYMSPEQARGHEVDKRSDIWAFGCVLYEMLCGRPAYRGATGSDTLALILQGDPDWSALPPDTPAPVKQLLQWCLQKEPKQRLRDIADARHYLTATSVPTSAATTIPRWPFAAALLTALVVTAASTWWVATRRAAASAPPQEERVLRRITRDDAFATEPSLSPDGSLLVYASDRGGQGNLDLWLQRLGGGTPVQLTRDPVDDREPGFSPDGTTIAFRSERDGGGIYVMPALGGDARLIAPQGRRPRFSPDGSRIVYWSGRWLGGTRAPGSAVAVVSANGGTPTPLADGFITARNPIFSPDGRHVLFFGRRGRRDTPPPTTLEGDAAPDEAFDWWLVPATGGEPIATGLYQRLIAGGAAFFPGWALESQPEAWNEDGVLFSATYGEATNLWRVKLAPSGQVTGPLVQLTTGAGADRFPSVDRRGRIAFQTSESLIGIYKLTLAPNDAKSLQEVTRLAADRSYIAHRGSVSADGVVAAYPKHGSDAGEVWAKALSSGVERHLVTVSGSGELNPTMSPDGTLVGYTAVDRSRRSGHVVPTAGGTARQVCESCTLHGWMSDNRRIIAVYSGGPPRVRLLDTSDGSTAGVFDTDTPINRAFATADGRWLAVGFIDGVWLTRLQPGRVATPAQSMTVTFRRTDVTPGRVCGWSPDGRLLYSLLAFDGFRCLYAQRFDPVAGRISDPFVVHHFHDPDRQWGSSPFSNAIVRDGFVFDQMETAGSIWLIDRNASVKGGG